MSKILSELDDPNAEIGNVVRWTGSGAHLRLLEIKRGEGKVEVVGKNKTEWHPLNQLKTRPTENARTSIHTNGSTNGNGHVEPVRRIDHPAAVVPPVVDRPEPAPAPAERKSIGNAIEDLMLLAQEFKDAEQRLAASKLELEAIRLKTDMMIAEAAQAVVTAEQDVATARAMAIDAKESLTAAVGV